MHDRCSLWFILPSVFCFALNGCASAAYCGHAHVTVITQLGSFIVNTSLGMSSITVQY